MEVPSQGNTRSGEKMFRPGGGENNDDITINNIR